MKRFLSLIIGIILLTTHLSVLAESTTLYKDTTASDWFYGSLSTLSTNKIITGYPDGSFRPQDTLNVDAYISILCRLTGHDVGLASGGYWAKNYIAYAKEHGWLESLTFTSYNVPINRYKAARLTAKALNYDSHLSPSELLDYKIYIDDYSNIPLLFRTDVLLNYALGLTTGYPNGTFQGSNTLTRAEASVISHRIFDPAVRKSLLSPEKTKKLLALFDKEQIAKLDEGFALIGGQMMFPMPAMPMPMPIPSLPLLPAVAGVTENVLADSLIALSDDATNNSVAAGYNYGLFNINLLSDKNESILIYTASDGSKIITLDLILMSDENGHLREDASELILLVCKNISLEDGDTMHNFILSWYAKRSTIPLNGVTATYSNNDLLLTNLVHDHNVTSVQFTLH